MILIAHAGHWALEAAPLFAIPVVLAVAARRSRRARDAQPPPAGRA